MSVPAEGHRFAYGDVWALGYLDEDDFCEQVDEIISVGQFYEKSAGAEIIFT